MKKIVISMLILLGIGVNVWGQTITPSYEETACPFMVVEPEVEGETVICGTLIVPESRSGLSDYEIYLQVVTIKSTNLDGNAPVVYLEGGPGGSAVAAVDAWYSSGLRAYSDLILVDQRGTGYSVPSLDCTIFQDSATEEQLNDPSTDFDALCRDGLIEQGVTLEAYTSAESAADFNDLLDVLDIPQANFFGISYGTRLGLTILRDYPSRVRSLIIDGVYPPNVFGYDEQASNFVGTLETLFADCAASATCTEAYGDLRALMIEMVDTLNENPLTGEDEYGEVVELYGDDVMDGIFMLMYDTSMIRYVPAIVKAALSGDYGLYEQATFGFPEEDGSVEEDFSDETSAEDMSEEELLELLRDYLAFETDDELFDYLDSLSDDEYNALVDEALMGGYAVDSDSEGLFNSIECYEEVGFNSYDRAVALTEGLPPQFVNMSLISIESTFATCAIWHDAKAPSFENDAVVSDVPTLVVSGQYDPVTPPSWGDVAAETLSNSFVFTFPAMGHGVTDTLPCPTQIAVAFLENPTQAPDSSCIAEMPAPDFYILR